MYLKLEELGTIAQSIVNEFPKRDFTDMDIIIKTNKEMINKINEKMYYSMNPDADNCDKVDEVDLNILGIHFKYVTEEKKDSD